VATVLIKKYGNRRLYDTSDSRYVTLDELAQKIRAGAELRVVDAQTGEDLTQATLTQLVLETGHAARFLPVQLLTQMIRLSDDALAEFFSRYVTGALDLYMQAKRGVQSIASYNPLAQLPIAATDALARMWMGGPFAGYQQPYPPGQQPYPPGQQPFPPGYAAPPQGYPPGAGYPAPPPPFQVGDDTDAEVRAAPEDGDGREGEARRSEDGRGRRAQTEPGRLPVRSPPQKLRIHPPESSRCRV